MPVHTVTIEHPDGYRAVCGTCSWVGATHELSTTSSDDRAEHIVDTIIIDAPLRVLVEAVKAHALAHYNDGGWDFIIECWTDEMLAREITGDGATTASEAIKAFEFFVDVMADRQAEADYQARQ
jgi:hypothetical protein